MVHNSSKLIYVLYVATGDRMRIKLKELWNNPRKIENGEWYILIMVFMTLWMWMVMKK